MRRTTSTYIAVTIAVVTAALFVAIPFASAHEFGSSFEAEIEDGMIDIGYSVEEFTDDTSVIFDFEVVDANKDEIPFTDVWVRLVRDKSTVLATGVHNADLGGSLLTYKFPSAGEYVLHARFQNNGDKVAEAEFPLMVQRGVTTRNGGSGALYAGMGFVGGMLLSIVPFLLTRRKDN